MYRRSILLIIISFGILTHTAENDLEINSAHPLKLRMMNLESELTLDAAESSYTRVIVWNMMPNSGDLQAHFNKFDLLRLEEKQLTSKKLDIMEKNEFTYERFLYAHFPEQQSSVTIFVKVNFSNKRNSFSLKSFVKKFNAALKKYGLTGEDVVIQDGIPSDSSTSSNTFIALVLIIILLLLIAIWKIIHPFLAPIYNKNNNMSCVHYNTNECLKELREYEQKLTIQEQTLSPNHPDLAKSHNHIGNMYCNMKNYPNALSSYKKVLAIQKQSLSPNHPDLAMTFKNIGVVYENMEKYQEACSSYQIAIQISEQSSPESYPNLKAYRKDLERVKKKL